jgi:hypothetical protein
MAAVGDQIEVSSKAGPRSGVVTGVNGHMIDVRWSTGEETSFVPGPGVLSVVKRRGSGGTSRVRARTGLQSRASKSVSKSSKRKRTATWKSRAAAKKLAKIKARSLVKRTATPKRTATKKAGTKRAPLKAAKRGNTSASTRRRPAATTKARAAPGRNLKAAKKTTKKSPAKKVKRASKSH